MTAAIFTPKADDKFATATQLVEVATIKPSGYVHVRAVAAPEILPQLVDSIKAYYEGKGRPEPVIYTRAIGTTDWVTDAPEVTIPDALPEGFGE